MCGEGECCSFRPQNPRKHSITTPTFVHPRPHQTHDRHNQFSLTAGHYLLPGAKLLPQLLKQAGCHTAIIGKWHLGIGSPNTPTERGFDLFEGFLGDMMDDYWTHRRHGLNLMRRNQEVIDPQGHATDIFTGWACEYLEARAKAGGPFLLYLAYNAPHDPIQPPPAWLEKVKQREPGISEKRAKLVALIEHLDFGIGKVLDTLDRTGLATNTLVIFTSDNGGVLANEANNGPWCGGKGHMYEGGLRVPGAARYPGRIQPGSRYRSYDSDDGHFCDRLRGGGRASASRH